MNRVIWKPQPKQAQFLARPEWEALYGGAAGGGKSDAMLAEALRQVEIPHYSGIIFRKTIKQLSDLVDRSRIIYKGAYPKAKFNETKLVWTFPSGAKIHFGNMQRDQDKYSYQGKSYDFVGFDELEHFTYSEYSYLFSRNRPKGPGTRCYIRATANPGGVGHAWVKQRFVTAGPPLTPIRTDLTVQDPKGNPISLTRHRVFVPATVFDNSKLLGADPNYLASLATLPEAEKKALLYGDWDSFSGQVFSEWKDNPDGYATRTWTHVIQDFIVPKHWTIYRSYDFGYAKPFSVGWYAVDELGTIYRVAELYGCTATPNEGVKWTVEETAKAIKDMESTHHNLKGRKVHGIADPSIWDKSRGESIADMFAASRVYFDKGDNHRLPGKMQFHYRLAFDKEGKPRFYCFESCRHFIRTVPALVYSSTKVEDVDTSGEDHIYDECRYLFMKHPIAARINEDRSEPQNIFDPLNLQPKREYDKYNFMRIF